MAHVVSVVPSFTVSRIYLSLRSPSNTRIVTAVSLSIASDQRLAFSRSLFS